VRRKAKAAGVLLCGDEPFIVGQDSADAWANPRILRRDARLGVPPDDFSATGQDWGLPYFDFAEMEKDDYAWLKTRARKAASYYDLRRVDHAVGYFRQWIRDEQSPTGRFVPPDEPSHRRLGERNFKLLADGAGIVAEDLGVIPPFVREKLAELQLPGYRVMRWERDDGHYRHPHHYPHLSLATTGTHDTDTLREWWEGAPDWEREAVARVYPELQSMQPPPRELTPAVHEALLAAAENSGSSLVVLPWQDVLGIRDRVNLPGSTGEANWSYRLPQSADQLMTDPQTRAGAERLARLTQAAGR
jgi:4-alpha-glucanotransferase